jgi:hypothetical protein
VERSIQAITTAQQALALINNSGGHGVQLLSKTTRVNLNPTVTLNYTGLVNTFTAGATITDSNGSTAIILTDNGSNSMTITSIVFSKGVSTFSGTITENTGDGTATIVTFDRGHQAITLTGGNTYIITDIVVTNVSIVLHNADEGYWGTTIGASDRANENTLRVISLSPNNYESITNGQIRISSNSVAVNSPIYFSLTIPEGSAATCDMYIYGYVLN